MMNRVRGPTFGGISKATPQTLCQKCLKRDNYECKATTQERPYASRPSRTQQLANPKLVPKLTSEMPNTLLRKVGIADEQLAKKEEERGRKRSADAEGLDRPRKRSRSSSSFTSVSTISTNQSKSISPRRSRSRDRDTYYTSQQDRSVLSSYDTRKSFKRKRLSTSRSSSYSTESSTERWKGVATRNDDRNTRRRRTSTSPRERGRHQDADVRRNSRRTKSRSMDRSQIARNRRSITPATHARDGRGARDVRSTSQDGDAVRQGNRRYPNENGRYDRNTRAQGRPSDGPRQGAVPAPPRKERSLSPFSKRLALTQAMNMGR